MEIKLGTPVERLSVCLVVFLKPTHGATVILTAADDRQVVRWVWPSGGYYSHLLAVNGQLVSSMQILDSDTKTFGNMSHLDSAIARRSALTTLGHFLLTSIPLSERTESWQT